MRKITQIFVASLEKLNFKNNQDGGLIPENMLTFSSAFCPNFQDMFFVERG
jgi:hypothetical protein